MKPGEIFTYFPCLLLLVSSIFYKELTFQLKRYLLKTYLTHGIKKLPKRYRV